MDKFLRRFSAQVIGVLHGFDRLRFRGSRRGLCYPAGLLGFLWHMRILLKDFGDLGQDTTNTLCQAGFRNRDLRPLWNGTPPVSASEQRRQSAAVTRQLRLWRAHGLIQKVSKTHRYLLTEKGQRNVTALLAARQADTPTLLKAGEAA